MSTIDDRVVSMQFDNATFESKLGATIRSIDSLKKSLDFSSSQQHIGDLENASKKFNMGNMAGAVDGVSTKFLALATVGVAALATITTKAISSALAFTNSFTLGPITEGFKEFETNMGSIQTILSNTQSKGSTLDDVNKALQDLNTYSDKTIYNFSEMARNIGTFTAAGVDLETSVQSIKGIANLAAISGSNSEQASTAMYQLSQAIANGSVKLMDWNSVVNAGMGGEVFQKALFESGKAMKTLTNVPAGQTFEQWKKAGNSFRDSLQDGWITGKVLTSTLKAFTGDLTEAQIMAMGYTKKQAAEMLQLGKNGLKAATQVKTLTQLIGTVKEAVGSGWTQTFQVLFGNFTESVALFTSISEAIGKIVGKSADARNELLQGWKDLGGRTVLIEAFKTAFTSLGTVLKAIKEAFREIFPAKTSADLMGFTTTFSDLMKALVPEPATIETIKSIFGGIFSIFSIGKTAIFGVFEILGTLLGGLAPASGGISTMAGSLGEWLIKLNDILVKGGGIERFVDKVKVAISGATDFVGDLITGILGFFGDFISGSDPMGVAVDGVTAAFDRFRDVGDRIKKIFEPLTGLFKTISDVFTSIGKYMVTWFSELGGKLADALGPEAFSKVMDVINVGLLGGIVILLKKFLSGEFKINFELFGKVNEALDAVTGTLKAMQAQLKASALMKIAISIGILTVAIVALSLINSADLTKALGAIAVGFAELVATMGGLSLIIGPGTAVKLMGLAIGISLMATAMVILSVAVKNLAGLSWNELATGLVGTAAGLTTLVIAAKFMSTNAKGMITGGVAMIAMATALNILASAVKSFGEMSWEDMAKGLIGIGVGLGVIVVAMKFMPGPTIIAAGLAMTGLAFGLKLLGEAVGIFGEMSWEDMAKGLIGVAVGLGAIVVAMNFMPKLSLLAAGIAMAGLAFGLKILGEAVRIFATMSWEDMAKGLLGVGVALGLIAAAMNFMPVTTPIIAAGLVVVGFALQLIANAVKTMGMMDLGEMAKGIGAFAAMLLIIAVAVNAMSGAIAGAIALGIVSGAMYVLAMVLTTLGNMSLGELALGLGAILAILVIFGLAGLVMAPVIPVLLSLGLALGAIGIAFTLFGIGAYLTATAFEILARAGKEGVKVLLESVVLVIKMIPQILVAMVEALLEATGSFIKAIETLLLIAGVFIVKLLDLVIELVPKIAEVIAVLITAVLRLIREKFPDVVRTGFEMLIALLTGIRDNISQITQLGIDIIVKFVEAIADNAEKLVNAAADLITNFLNAIAARAADIVDAGYGILKALIKGVIDNVADIVLMVADLITEFIKAIDGSLQKIIDAGGTLIVNFIQGIGKNMIKIVSAATDVAIAFINAIGDNALKFATAAADALTAFLNGLADAIRNKAPEIRQAGLNVADAIVDGITGGLADKAGNVATGAIDMAKGAVGGVLNFLQAKSPSKLFEKIGGFMGAGMALGLKKDTSAENSAVAQAERIVAAFAETLSRTPDMLVGLDASPVITPVLDLTKVKEGAVGLDKMMSLSTITPDISLAQARLIATTAETTGTADQTPAYTGPSEVKFEQNNYSPEALSTNDIYRNTKSQIALAKEELNI